MGQFKEMVEGISEACKAFEIPVTGGNVSFYNDTEGVSIYPTPVLGIVGLIKDINKVVTPGFKEEGDAVVLLGENKEELGGSEYLKIQSGREDGNPPAINLAKEKAVQELCLEAAEAGFLESAHDLSEGGLAVCAAECGFFSGKKIGCELDLNDEWRPDALLFGETQSRILVTAKSPKLKKLLALAGKKGVKAAAIGKVGGKKIRISLKGKALVNVPVEEVYKEWKEAIPRNFTVK
jgi:phosphoribosylformylglycinamidine synthase